jgi:hypothetical protein
MRSPTWIIIACLAATLSVRTAAADEDSSRDRSAADARRAAREEEKHVLAALEKRISLVCEDMPLQEAIRKLGQLIDLEILIDTTVLADVGISLDQGVTLTLGELTAWQTLHLLLKPLQLTWLANDGVLEITTLDKASEVMVTRVYDVSKLCTGLEPLVQEMIAARAKRSPNSIGICGMDQEPFGAMKSGSRFVEAELAQMIRGCIPLGWEDMDGEGGAVKLGKGCLIISQEYHGQFEIAGLLKAIERLADGNHRGKSIAARRIGYPADEDAAIFETLAKPLTIQIQDETLHEVIARIAAESKIRIWVDQSAVSDERISIDKVLNARMRNLPLAICLNKILDPLDLAIIVEEGVLIVTTQQCANETMEVRLYDVGGISRIAINEQPGGLTEILSNSSNVVGWRDPFESRACAKLISIRHMAVRQTQQTHARLALLIDDLTTEELIVPADPPLETRVYTAPDTATATDLERVLPQLLDKQWAARGSIRKAGSSLIVDQPSAVHDRLDELMGALDQSYQRRNPNPRTPANAPADEPGQSSPADQTGK